MTKLLLPLFLLLAVTVGCVTNTLTNITPTEVARSTNGMYRIEYQWDSTQQTVRPGSIKPYVIIGFDQYEMRQVMKMNNRWEVWVPAPVSKTEIVYHFKVDYQYTDWGKVGSASKLSPEYKLIIK